MLRIYLLSFLLHFTSSRVNRNLQILCGLDEVRRDSVAMRFYIQIENTGKDCKVECIPDKCCLEQGNEENCDVLKMFGGSLENLGTGESRMVRLAVPLLEQFDRHGFCIVHVNSKVKGLPLYRDTVTISFDTGKPLDVRPCAGVDQDALNDCQPVICDMYYNGQKPHFSKRLKRCVEAPLCSGDDIYDENLNKCVQPVTDEDIKIIESINNRKLRSSKGKAANGTKTKTLKVTEKNLKTAKLIKEKENFVANTETMRFFYCFRSPKILFCVISIQCCVVLALALYIRQRCHCVQKEKEVLKKFFNYRQNDSTTTPLISVSHGTATTCQFQSDSSSNIDKKITFYKACQDKRAKASMSDDILSRCLKRRDWITKPKSPEKIHESKKEDHGIQVYDTELKSDKSGKLSHKKDSLPIQISSEEQVKTFEYEPHNFYAKYVTEIKKTCSLTEKCAQACFPKDSIDQFLSERGLTQSNINLSGSSRTSKNNLDSVLSMMSRVGPFSDPGGSEDLELLHMSRASVYSSSNASDYETKRVKESRSSL